MNTSPLYKDFVRLQNSYSHVPVSAEIPGDTDTPVSLYLKIRDISPYSFLLESALQTDASGRYSIIGFSPEKVLRYRGNKLKIIENGKDICTEESLFDYVRSLLSRYNLPVPENGLPVSGGLFGAFAYDSIRLIEEIPDSHQNNFDTDDCTLMLVETLIIFDHFKHTITISSLAPKGDFPEIEYEKATAKIRNIIDTLRSPKPLPQLNIKDADEKIEIIPEITRDEFKNIVQKAKEHITAGDIFQIVLSQRFCISVNTDSFNIYRVLRSLNPSPYMFYLSLEDEVIAGSSPEVLVKLQNNIVTTRPLAGTRPRGETPFEDKEIEEELLSDEKERAEHIMLVDLGRNDLGRFCKFGSISLPEFFGIERYSHVMHVVSEVAGFLDEEKDAVDVFCGSFPAGTVSGAPKIRAMELIDEFETSRRGIYAGAVGYFDFHNNLDTCITIRTLFIKDNTAYIQAGAGIVADSDPENEYRETINKAAALIKAVAIAEGKRYDPDNR
ncbi:anthranilate synthase component I [candidate division KSB1 bacterium]